MTAIDKSVLDKFRKVATPTLATALFKRGLRSQCIQGVLPLAPLKESMVGPAFTVRSIPAREDLNQLSVFRDPTHPQRVAVETCPPGAVMVVDSRGDPRAASGGGILARRLMVRGVAGVVTDGGFRDSAEIAEMAMPLFHRRPSAPTNLTLHQAIDINVPIGCGEAPVFPGDIIVGDADGVMVVPAHLAAELAEETTQMTIYEDFVIDMVKDGHAVIGLYPMTDSKYEDVFARWRAEKKR